MNTTFCVFNGILHRAGYNVVADQLKSTEDNEIREFITIDD